MHIDAPRFTFENAKKRGYVALPSGSANSVQCTGAQTVIFPMHELSIAQSILDIIHQYVPADDGAKVKTVRLNIGAMAGVVTDSLEFCFSAITQGTPVQGATLEIKHIPLTARCNACGTTSAIEPTRFICSACDRNDLTIVSGREMQVSEIELTDENGTAP